MSKSSKKLTSSRVKNTIVYREADGGETFIFLDNLIGIRRGYETRKKKIEGKGAKSEKIQVEVFNLLVPSIQYGTGGLSKNLVSMITIDYGTKNFKIVWDYVSSRL